MLQLFHPWGLYQFKCFNNIAYKAGKQGNLPHGRFSYKYAQKEKPTGSVEHISAVFGNNGRDVLPILARGKANGDNKDETNKVGKAAF